QLSGKDRRRPALEAALKFCREQDVLIVHSMDRLARNLVDLLGIVTDLNRRGVTIEFVKERLTFNGEDNPLATLQIQILGAFAQFERALILSRQREGIVIARAAGKYRGRKRALNAAQAAELRELAAKGTTKAALAEFFGVSRETVYSYLREGGLSQRIDIVK